MIEFKDVHLKYHYDEFEVLKGASFCLTDGLNTILCDVQSGKTSLCKLLVKQAEPTSGQILLDGQSLSGIAHANLDILYLPSKPVFFERKSILYNIEYPLKLRKFPKQVRRGEAMALAERFGFENVGCKAGKLSSEQRKKLALARGMTVARRIVVWDDFFDDAAKVDEALALFEGATHVIVTSNASQARGNTVVLDGGVTVFCGDAAGAVKAVNGLQWLCNSLRSEQ